MPTCESILYNFTPHATTSIVVQQNHGWSQGYGSVITSGEKQRMYYLSISKPNRNCNIDSEPIINVTINKSYSVIKR